MPAVQHNNNSGKISSIARLESHLKRVRVEGGKRKKTKTKFTRFLVLASNLKVAVYGNEA